MKILRRLRKFHYIRHLRLPLCALGCDAGAAIAALLSIPWATWISSVLYLLSTLIGVILIIREAKIEKKSIKSESTMQKKYNKAHRCGKKNNQSIFGYGTAEKYCIEPMQKQRDINNFIILSIFTNYYAVHPPWIGFERV